MRSAPRSVYMSFVIDYMRSVLSPTTMCHGGHNPTTRLKGHGLCA